jgi:predicted transcriptional regulator
MALAKLTKLELKVMDAFWRLGASSVREALESLPEKGRPAYTTVQTVVYRLERKKVLRCVKRISNANIFEAAITRAEAHERFVSELLGLFDGRVKMLMAHLIDSGELTLKDVKDAEAVLTASKSAGQRVSESAKSGARMARRRR